MIKELVQFLVGIVDAELLERIDGKVLEPENIQHPQKSKKERYIK